MLASKRVMVSGAHLDDRGVLDGQAAELALELAAVPQALHHHIEEAVVFPDHVLQPWRGHCPGQHLLGWGLGIFGQLGWRRLRLVQRCLQCIAGPGQSLPASPLLCSPHVPAASPVRRSHDNCEEVLDHWFKHMAHYSVLSPSAENHREVASQRGCSKGQHGPYHCTWQIIRSCCSPGWLPARRHPPGGPALLQRSSSLPPLGWAPR